MHHAYKHLIEKIKESLASVLPISIIVLILCFLFIPVPIGFLMSFIIGSLLMVIGMGFFTLGADMSMTTIGTKLGSQMTKSKKLHWIILGGFFLGFVITVSEPDLQVLASQVNSIPSVIQIVCVAAGAGIFLVVSLLKTLFRIKISYILFFFYAIIFILAAFTPEDFVTVAFDSGGVTTGSMTVPFIMALGLGVSSVRSDENATNDSFGYVALCSIGPVLAVMILGLVYSAEPIPYSLDIPQINTSRELWLEYISNIPYYMGEVALSLLPFILLFAGLQIFTLKIPKHQLLKICVGLFYTYIGIVLFLTGVNVGFLAVGNYLGNYIASSGQSWILIPAAMLIGYFIVQAEPAVYVLKKQVEEITNGAIPQKAMHISLSIGISLSLGLAMLRILFGIPFLWIIVPGYVIAIALTFVTPDIFTSIAFDSGGVASGTMTATFVLPFAIGASNALGGNVITDAFGIIAIVATIPLITIQILGLIYNIKYKKKVQSDNADALSDNEIIDV